MKKLITTLTLCTLVITAFSCNNGKLNGNEPQTDTTEQEPEEHHLSLLIAGDLMQHGGQLKGALQADGSYSYEECFRFVKPEIERADVAIANFEVTLGGKPYKAYPQFSAPDEFLKATVDAGFDILLTANNHCLDTYQKGLERTIELMDKLPVPHLGTYVNAEARRQQYPFLLEKNGFRIVLLNFTYGTNGLKVTPPNIVNYIDTVEIKADIAKARQMKPDFIIAIPHWGIEYQLLPSAEQKQLADWLLKQGVDHIIGGHPHVPQPIELRNNGNTLVAYSLGNYISNQARPNTYGGVMVRMELSKKGSKAQLDSAGYCLYFVSRPAESGRKNFRIYSINTPDSMLNARERERRNTFAASIRSLFKQHNKGNIKEYKF